MISDYVIIDFVVGGPGTYFLAKNSKRFRMDDKL